MRPKGNLLIHLAALAVAALATWFVFQKGDDSSRVGEVILDARIDEISRIEYRSDTKLVRAERLEGSDAFQLTVKEQVSKRKPVKRKPSDTKETSPVAQVDGGAADGATDPQGDPVPTKASPPVVPGEGGTVDPDRETKVTRYRASPEFRKALERQVPLMALRDVGQVSAGKLLEFGLKEPKGHLSITTRGQTAAYSVGEYSFGRNSVYLRSDPDGPVSLVSSGILRTVDFRPPRYKELRFLGLALKEVERIEFDCAGLGKRTLLHQKADTKGPGRWVPADAPETDDDLYRNWAGKLLRLSVSTYLDGPIDGGGASRCAFRFTHGGKTDEAQVTWTGDETGKRTFHGRSDFSGDWVELEPSGAGAVVNDLTSLFETPAVPVP